MLSLLNLIIIPMAIKAAKGTHEGIMIYLKRVTIFSERTMLVQTNVTVAAITFHASAKGLNNSLFMLYLFI